MFRRSSQVIPVLILFTALAGCGAIRIVDRPPTGIESETDFDKHIEEIRIEGLSYTKEWVVVNQMYSRVGDVYTEEAATLDYRYLDQLKVFSSINLRADQNPDGDGVILTVTVTEINPYTPSLKIGITDENGFSLGLGGASSNLMGTALKANASFNFGGQSGVRAGLSSPWRPGRLLQYDIVFSWQTRDNKSDNFRENAIELNTAAQRNIGRHWRLGAFFDYFSIGSDTTGITLSPDNRDNVPRLGGFIGFDSRDIARDPRNGIFAYVDVGKSGSFLGGPADYWRANVDVRAYWSPWRRHTFALFSFNTRTSGQVGTDIPVWDDFHIGGTNTVRGWNFGARVGKNQTIGTFEYRYMLVEPKLIQLWFLKMDLGIQLAAFVDAGTAYNSDDRPRDNFISGAGAGIRLIVPAVNMIRFDFAGGQPNIGISLHIGSNSKARAQRNRVR